MSFKILHIEDNRDFAKKIEDAVASSNSTGDRRPLELKTIFTPDELSEALNADYDLVVADLRFPDETDPDRNRLDDIIRIIKAWSGANNRERPLPIIAYTRREGEALDYCLARREDLFDIWDKSAASPAYAAWRLSRIALEISRARPDSVLERLIRTMEPGASWHEQVVEMARRYANGWTEADQIDQVGKPIEAIAHRLGVFPRPCENYWNSMAEWEPLGRAVSLRTRGHARHVVNVFWLGYYLIHHPALRDLFAGWWMNLVADRRDMKPVRETQPLEALSNCWFYAGLFHDVANCVQENRRVAEKMNTLLGRFDGMIAPYEGKADFSQELQKAADKLFHDLGDSLGEQLSPHWVPSFKHGEPDHGVVAAAHLVRSIEEPAQQCFAREAARAMVIHNIVGRLSATPAAGLSWEDEPIACLLVLCDQLQTWDRERGDNRMSDKDEPERAELLGLKIDVIDGRPRVEMAIEYIAPRHLDHAPLIFQRVKDELETILKKKPHDALRRINRPWPFDLSVKCWLSGRPLDTPMDFNGK